MPVSSQLKVSSYNSRSGRSLTISHPIIHLSPHAAYIPAIAALGKAAPPLKAVYSRSFKSAESLSTAAVKALSIPAPDVYHDGENGGGVDAILARRDISSVLLVLPIPLQPSMILKALKAGKHVLSEKPVAPDVASGIALIKQYRSEFQGKGLVWRVAENYEVEPGFQEVGRLISGGAIGKVIGFKACVLNYVDKDSKWYKTPWRTVPEVRRSSFLPLLACLLTHRLTRSIKEAFWYVLFLSGSASSNIPVDQLDGGVVSISTYYLREGGHSHSTF